MMILGVMMLIIICTCFSYMLESRSTSNSGKYFLFRISTHIFLFRIATYIKLQNFMDFVYLAENGRNIFYGNKFSKSVISQYYQTCLTKMAQLKMRQNIHNLKKNCIFSDSSSCITPPTNHPFPIGLLALLKKNAPSPQKKKRKKKKKRKRRPKG